MLPHCTLQFGPDLSLVLGKLLEQAPINDCGVRLGLTAQIILTRQLSSPRIIINCKLIFIEI